MALGVVPSGGLKSRFSTWPSENTSTTKRLFRRQGHEIDVLDRRLMFRREDKACALRRGRQGGSNAVQHALDVGGVRLKRLSSEGDLSSCRGRRPRGTRRRTGADPFASAHAPAEVCGLPSKPEELQILHHVADGRRRNLFRQRSGQRARPHRRSGFEIPLDHAAKHLARAIVEFFEYAALFCHGGAIECRVARLVARPFALATAEGCGLCLAQANGRVSCVLRAET
jgi:hypothetical protein